MNEEYAKLNIAKRALADLKPHPQNPRQHPDEQIRILAKSIEQFAYAKGSICIQKGTDYILAGHAIRGQLLEKGYKEADVIELDFDDAKSLAFLVADNQYPMLADWDLAQLDTNLAELEELDFELDDLGFDVDSLEDIYSEAEPQEVEEDDFDTEDGNRRRGYHVANVSMGCFASILIHSKDSDKYRELLNWKDTLNDNITAKMVNNICGIIPDSQYYDYITCPPSGKSTKGRPYPALHLIQQVSNKLELPVQEVFTKTGDYDKSRAPKRSYFREMDDTIALKNSFPSQQSVLIIDDLITTGKTLKTCTLRLRRQLKSNVTPIAYACFGATS